MAKVEEIKSIFLDKPFYVDKKKKPRAFVYRCTCGQKVTFYLEERPNRLLKCFFCNEKFDLKKGGI